MWWKRMGIKRRPSEAISIIVFNYRVWLGDPFFDSCSVTKKAVPCTSVQPRWKKKRSQCSRKQVSGFLNGWHLAKLRNTSATNVSRSLSRFSSLSFLLTAGAICRSVNSPRHDISRPPRKQLVFIAWPDEAWWVDDLDGVASGSSLFKTRLRSIHSHSKYTYFDHTVAGSADLVWLFSLAVISPL